MFLCRPPLDLHDGLASFDAACSNKRNIGQRSWRLLFGRRTSRERNRSSIMPSRCTMIIMKMDALKYLDKEQEWKNGKHFSLQWSFLWPKNRCFFRPKYFIYIMSPFYCTRPCVVHGRRTYDCWHGTHFGREHLEVFQRLASRLQSSARIGGLKLTLLRKWRFSLPTGRP